MSKSKEKPKVTYAAAEIFGISTDQIEAEELQRLLGAEKGSQPCPFRSGQALCSKPSGVCSIALVEDDEGRARRIGEPVTTCPNRFNEGNIVHKWIGKTLLGSESVEVLGEVPFLAARGGRAAKKVGKIDNVLVASGGVQLQWCAVEMQAVYFSGGAMSNDFNQMRTWTSGGIPQPTVSRHPDFRSSGPKRLMPQLQTKVPTLRRWGKKMAVIVDNAFWNSLDPIREVDHLSSADIVWFVVEYVPVAGGFQLTPKKAFMTTLESSVEGLTGGDPVSLELFETSIREKLGQRRAT